MKLFLLVIVYCFPMLVFGQQEDCKKSELINVLSKKIDLIDEGEDIYCQELILAPNNKYYAAVSATQVDSVWYEGSPDFKRYVLVEQGFLVCLDTLLNIEWIKSIHGDETPFCNFKINNIVASQENLWVYINSIQLNGNQGGYVYPSDPILAKLDLDGNFMKAGRWSNLGATQPFNTSGTANGLYLNKEDYNLIINDTRHHKISRIDEDLNLVWSSQLVDTTKIYGKGIYDMTWGGGFSNSYLKNNKVYTYYHVPDAQAGQSVHPFSFYLNPNDEYKVFMRRINGLLILDYETGLIEKNYNFGPLGLVNEDPFLRNPLSWFSDFSPILKDSKTIVLGTYVINHFEYPYVFDAEWLPSISVFENDTLLTDFFYYRMDSTLTEKRFRATKLMENRDGYVMAFSSRGFSGRAINTGLEGNLREMDNYLIGLDSSFNVIWSQAYGGDDVEAIFGVTKSHDDGFVIMGDTHNWDLRDTTPGLYIQKTNERGFCGRLNHKPMLIKEKLPPLMIKNASMHKAMGQIEPYYGWTGVDWLTVVDETWAITDVPIAYDTLPDLIPRQYKILSHCENEFEIELPVCNIGEHFANYSLPLYFGNNPTDTAWIKPLLDYYECDTLRFTITSDADSLNLYIGMSPDQYAQHLIDGFRPWMVMSECDYTNNKTTIALPLSAQNIDTTICVGSSFYINGEQVENTGIFYENNTNQYGCDSLVIWSVYVEDLLDEVSLHINPYHDGEKGSISVETNYSGLAIGLSSNSLQSDLLIEDLNPGSYTLFVQSPNSCLIKIPFVIENTTGLRDIAKENWSFYPNPAHNVIHFTKRGDYRVYDVNGRLILSCEKKVKLDLSTLVGGVYFVEGFGKWKKLVVGN